MSNPCYALMWRESRAVYGVYSTEQNALLSEKDAIEELKNDNEGHHLLGAYSLHSPVSSLISQSLSLFSPFTIELFSSVDYSQTIYCVVSNFQGLGCILTNSR